MSVGAAGGLGWDAGHASVYNSHPKQYGLGANRCRVCANRHALIKKYNLMMCRQCFRHYSKDIGFQKLK
jgi:small subunit ribosomal protein S29e